MVAQGQRGLSLVELLVGLVVLSVLVSVAAPSFSRMVAEQRLRQVGSELRISLATARSEAVKRNEAVSLIKQGSDWSTGWCIEAGKTSNCSAQPIQQFNVASDQITVLKDGAAAGTEINFNAWGRVTSCPEFLLSTTAAGSACALCLVVTTDGRVESHSGSCPETDACSTEGSDMSWAGACS
jgi:type IV fimbrial biogenesis protein FimT